MPHTVRDLRSGSSTVCTPADPSDRLSRLTSWICNLALGLTGLPDLMPCRSRRIVCPADRPWDGARHRFSIPRQHQSLWWELNVYSFCLASTAPSVQPLLTRLLLRFNERPAQCTEPKSKNQRVPEKYSEKHSHRIKWYPRTDDTMSPPCWTWLGTWTPIIIDLERVSMRVNRQF